MADLWRDFWIRETGTGKQVAQLYDRYTMMMAHKIAAAHILVVMTLDTKWEVKRQQTKL